MLEPIGGFLLAVVVLALGGDSLARGLGGLAQRAGASAVATGIVVCAFAGSLPDLAVNVAALFAGKPAFALGNIVGSSLVNLGLALGLAALVAPLSVHLPLLRPLFPALLLSALAVLAMGWNGIIGYFDGIALVVGFFVLVLVVARHRATRTEANVAAELEAIARTRPSPALNLLRVAIGIALLVLASRWLVKYATLLAPALGMSEMLFGLVVLAIGTSLPQIVVAIVGAQRGHGNAVVLGLVGSTLFNLLLLLGVTAILYPLAMPASLVRLEIPALVAFALALYPMLRGDLRVARGEGGILLAMFAVLLAWQLRYAWA
ncbi:MAG TPA: sodium:calcium antiporter [Xanthomonadales bacterium]|nr:sodium:calcium antiporter [Xanthomonadales bacterium]